MKFKMPKIGAVTPKVGKAPRLPHRGIRTAFGSGKTAFGAPASMTMPDQAFGAAMAMPQGEAPTTPQEG